MSKLPPPPKELERADTRGQILNVCPFLCKIGELWPTFSGIFGKHLNRAKFKNQKCFILTFKFFLLIEEEMRKPKNTGGTFVRGSKKSKSVRIRYTILFGDL